MNTYDTTKRATILPWAATPSSKAVIMYPTIIVDINTINSGLLSFTIQKAFLVRVTNMVICPETMSFKKTSESMAKIFI